MTVLCLMIVESVEKTENRVTVALIPRIESRKDLTSSLRSKKQASSTKIQSSQFKMQSDGTIILTPVGLALSHTRVVLSGKECAMNSLQIKATLSGDHQAYPYMTFDKVRLEIAGS